MKIYVVLVAFAVAILPTANPQAGEVYENATIGFSIEKPDDWHFATAEQHEEALGRIEMSSEEYTAALLKYSTTPLVGLMKYPDPFADLNPSLKVNIKPYGDLDRSDPKIIIDLLLPTFEQMMRNFEVIEGPVDTKVSDIPSAYVRFAYHLDMSDGQGFATTSELWIVPRDDHFFVIGSATRTDEATGSREEVGAIVRSITIRE